MNDVVGVSQITGSGGGKTGVTTKHPEYTAMVPTWEDNVAAIAGQAYVKQLGTKFLKSTYGMDRNWVEWGQESYESYKDRARFPDIAQESLEGMLGVMFGNEPNGDLDEVVTQDGLTLLQLARYIAVEVFTKGGIVLVVDKDEKGEYNIVTYDIRSFINWKEGSDGKPTLGVFEEQKFIESNEFAHDTEAQYRVFTNGLIRVYDKEENIVNTFEGPSEVPIIPIGAVDCSCGIDRPPVTRIVECSLAAYRNSADYQMAMYLTSQPTPWSSGVSESQYKKNSNSGIGSSSHWYLGKEPNARCGYMEFQGNGIAALKVSQDHEIATAAEYAVKLIHVSGVESADAKRIRESAQKSTLSMMADSISIGINKALDTLSKLSVTPRSFKKFSIHILSVEEAKSEMVKAIGERVWSNSYPSIINYNYAVKTGLFTGTLDEWLEALKADSENPELNNINNSGVEDLPTEPLLGDKSDKPADDQRNGDDSSIPKEPNSKSPI